jgi:hypothetical protein
MLPDRPLQRHTTHELQELVQRLSATSACACAELGRIGDQITAFRLAKGKWTWRRVDDLTYMQDLPAIMDEPDGRANERRQLWALWTSLIGNGVSGCTSSMRRPYAAAPSGGARRIAKQRIADQYSLVRRGSSPARHASPRAAVPVPRCGAALRARSQPRLRASDATTLRRAASAIA